MYNSLWCVSNNCEYMLSRTLLQSITHEWLSAAELNELPRNMIESEEMPPETTPLILCLFIKLVIKSLLRDQDPFIRPARAVTPPVGYSRKRFQNNTTPNIPMSPTKYPYTLLPNIAASTADIKQFLTF